MGLCIFQTTQNNLHNICKMFQKIPKCDSKRFPRITLQPTFLPFFAPTSPDVLRTCCTLQSRSATRIFELLLFPPEGGGDHRGGVGVIGGRDSPWDERVGFEAPVSGGSTPLLLPHTHSAQAKGEPLLIACRSAAVRRGTACIAMHAAAAGPVPTAYVLLDVRA